MKKIKCVLLEILPVMFVFFFVFSCMSVSDYKMSNGKMNILKDLGVAE